MRFITHVGVVIDTGLNTWHTQIEPVVIPDEPSAEESATYALSVRVITPGNALSRFLTTGSLDEMVSENERMISELTRSNTHFVSFFGK